MEPNSSPSQTVHFPISMNHLSSPKLGGEKCCNVKNFCLSLYYRMFGFDSVKVEEVHP